MRGMCQALQQPGRVIGWCGESQRKSSPKRTEEWKATLVCTEKRLVQSVRNPQCTGVIGDEFGKEGRCDKMKIPLGPVLELEL